jgi:hypothetical protein
MKKLFLYIFAQPFVTGAEYHITGRSNQTARVLHGECNSKSAT